MINNRIVTHPPSQPGHQLIPSPYGLIYTPNQISPASRINSLYLSIWIIATDRQPNQESIISCVTSIISDLIAPAIYNPFCFAFPFHYRKSPSLYCRATSFFMTLLGSWMEIVFTYSKCEAICPLFVSSMPSTDVKYFMPNHRFKVN